MLFPYKNSIARQFIVYILLFSMVITTLLTAMQLYLDYRFGIEQIHSRARLVQKSYLQSITNAVWVFDTDVLNSLIDGLSEIPDVIYVEVRDKDKIIANKGQQTGHKEISQSFPLVYHYQDRDIPLGKIKVVFTLQNLYQHLLKKVFVIAITQGVKTLLVSLFIFFIFYRLVGRHLIKIAEYAEQLKSNTLDQPLTLERKARHQPTHNEIDQLVSSLNTMRQYFLQYHRQIEQDQLNLRLFKTQIEQSRDCMYIVDPESADIIDVNQAVVDLLGYSREELLKMKAIDFSHTFKTLQDWRAFIRKVEAHPSGRLIEGQHITRSGRRVPIEASAKIIDLDGRPIYVAFARDISERKDAQKILEFQAQHDQLTHLPNRILLKDRIGQMIRDANRDNGKVALLFIDLDHFKHINDSYGHNFGDEVLLNVSARLTACLRKSDTLARLGGDEFVALTRLDDSIADASVLAQKLLQSLHDPFNIHGVQLVLNMSIGISIYPDDSHDAELLLRNADAAMYKAKSTGRNNFKFYSPELTEQAELRIQMEHDINQAIINDEFVVYLQPQIDIDKGCIIGAEALVRWIHPVKGFMPPGDFISIAEQTGQINLIDQWVLNQVARFIVEQDARQIEIPRISVNFSGRDFELEPLSQSIPAILQSARCAPARIEIEITETQLMKHPQTAIRELTQLQQLGLSIAIDDFGTGYSSLNHLKNMPISKLKIDQSFVRDVCTDKNDRAIIRAIIALGKSLDLELIAEGVETRKQQEFLSTEGCRLIQGYLYSKPLPMDEFMAFMHQFSPDVA